MLGVCTDLIVHALQNKRVVLSDTDTDLDYNSDESIDHANTTKLYLSHLSSKTNAGTGDTSDDSRNEGLHGVSGDFDKDTPSATSKIRDPSCHNATTRSDNDTSSKILGLKTFKRKAGIGGIGTHNIITPSPRAPQNDDEGPTKCRRLMRGHGRSTVSYDMKHHPMDDILRPKHPAKRRGKGNQVSEESSDGAGECSEDDKNEASSKKETSPDPHRRRSSRNVHQSGRPIYSVKWHPLDQMLKDNLSSTRVSKKDRLSRDTHKSSSSPSTIMDEKDSVIVSSDLDPDQYADRASELEGRTAPLCPNQRRSARVSSSKDGPPNYDMKYGDPIRTLSTSRLIIFFRYHVMDSILRPKAAAKRINARLQAATSSKNLTKSKPISKTHIKQLAKDLPKSSVGCSEHHESEFNIPNVAISPSSSQLHNPYIDRVSLNWTEIQEMDRCLYRLQRGAPLHGNTLPQNWSHDAVEEILFDEGMNTLDELSGPDSIELLQARYESVRLGLENFFNSMPEPVNKTCWTLSKTEGFDVYDTRSGSKYWRHQKDSVVGGTKTSRSTNILGQSKRQKL